MQKRLAYVDGLRAVAVLAVALFHARVHTLGLALEPWAKECSHGVDLFFVVSGFCLAFPTFEKLRATGHARFDTVAFALKRFLRIVPPYAVALALVAAIGWFAVARGLALPEGMSALAPDQVVRNLFFLDRDQTYGNKSFWTLAIEFRWYFVFPFALWLAVRNVRALAAAIVLIAAAGEFTRAGSVDVEVLPAFLLGVAAAYVRSHDGIIARYAVPGALAALLFALLDEQRPHFPIQTNAGWQAVAFFAVIAAGKWTWLQRVLSWPALTRIGGASYSIYLVHEPIVSALVAGLRPRIGDAAATGAAIAAGVAAGFVLWAIVERPLTRPDFVARFVERGRARVERLFETAGVARFFDVRRPAETIATVTLAETRFAFVEIGTATSPDGPPRRTRGPSPLESGLAIVLFASLCAGSALAQSTTTSSSGVQVIDMNPVAPAPAAPRRKGGPRSGAKPPRSGNESSSAAALLKTALSYVGTPFVMGGTSPSGFDCSGFVQFAYASIGIHIPRTADQQFYAGRQIAGDPLPGDLLFFQTYEYGPSHVAIYLGNDQFVNAIGKDVHVASFSSDYFRSRYLGARRFLPD